ncbi:MAG TPA: hypothetical protein VLZ10_19310 [Thermodesulfobacteriota bacterium]|nr:hypothetical protein [Thermodesulfobacteriota bacterium]
MSSFWHRTFRTALASVLLLVGRHGVGADPQGYHALQGRPDHRSEDDHAALEG